MKTKPDDSAVHYLNKDQRGLTKREYFAGLAMQGLLVNVGRNRLTLSDGSVSKMALTIADELIEELSGVEAGQ